MAGRPPEPDDEREPTPDADDIDARFADITASLDDLTVPPAEDDEDPSSDAAPDPEPAETGAGPRDYALGPEVAPASGDDEPGYRPPEPPPLVGGDTLVAAAWAGVSIPIGLVLIFLLLWRGMPEFILLLAGVAFVLSVGVLLWRMPGKRDADDHDDGAVV